MPQTKRGVEILEQLHAHRRCKECLELTRKFQHNGRETWCPAFAALADEYSKVEGDRP